MGKRSRAKARQSNKKHNKGQGKRGQWRLEITKESKLFENYYKGQNLIPEEEWEDFMAALKRDLPSTFRICGTKKLAKDLLGVLKKDYIKEMEGLKIEDEEVASPTPLPWYPDELAWESKLSRRIIRKSTKLWKFHDFLVQESSCGAITRQEAVSMIPPFFLDVLPHHKILDMCAAPGSKTTQLLEMIHSDEGSQPAGCIIANDVDNKRCYMLVHQSKRIQSPSCVVTNHDATIYPFPTKPECPGGKRVPIHFDRILCDVPCSGDGTLRKNPLIWEKWTPHLGVALHRLQMKILVRGLELLSPGGRIVYSTCSMNPIEDEAVVAETIRKSEGAVHLIDVSSCLPGLKRSPGLTTWKVYSRDGREYKTFEDVDCGPKAGYKETMFPPSKEDAESMQLKKCVRVYPHQQDTGGFFIAVLTKTKRLPWEDDEALWQMASRKYLPWEWLERKKNAGINTGGASSSEKQETETEEVGEKLNSVTEMKEEDSEIDRIQSNENQPPKKKRRTHGFKEDPYVFLKEDDEHLKQIQEFYNLSSSLHANQLLVRTTDGRKRNIYMVSESVREIIENNEDVFKIINSGVKVFTRCGLKTGKEVGCDFRLTQEGLLVFHHYVGSRIVEIDYADLVVLLTQGEPYQSKMSDSTQSQLTHVGPGCTVWHYKPGSSDAEKVLSSDIYICGFKGKTSVRCMMSREERMHLLRVLGLPTEKVKQKIPADENNKEDEGGGDEEEAEGEEALAGENEMQPSDLDLDDEEMEGNIDESGSDADKDNKETLQQ